MKQTIHDLEQEPDQNHEEKDHIDTTNIYSIGNNSKSKNVIKLSFNNSTI